MYGLFQKDGCDFKAIPISNWVHVFEHPVLQLAPTGASQARGIPVTANNSPDRGTSKRTIPETPHRNKHLGITNDLLLFSTWHRSHCRLNMPFSVCNLTHL